MTAADKETITMNEKRPKYLTYPELAQALNLPVGTLYSKVASHSIPHVRLGRRLVRFDTDKIAAWLRAQEIAPAK
jgi:excisionase family DNA binding protein